MSNIPKPVDKLRSTKSSVKTKKESLVVTGIYAQIFRDIQELIKYQHKRWGTKRKHSPRMSFLLITEEIGEFAEAIDLGHDDVIITEALDLAAFIIQWIATYWDRDSIDIDGTRFQEKSGQRLIGLFEKGLQKIARGTLQNKRRDIKAGIKYLESYTRLWKDVDNIETLELSTVSIIDTVDTLKKIEKQMITDEVEDPFFDD